MHPSNGSLSGASGAGSNSSGQQWTTAPAPSAQQHLGVAGHNPFIQASQPIASSGSLHVAQSVSTGVGIAGCASPQQLTQLNLNGGFHPHLGPSTARFQQDERTVNSLTHSGAPRSAPWSQQVRSDVLLAESALPYGMTAKSPAPPQYSFLPQVGQLRDGLQIPAASTAASLARSLASTSAASHVHAYTAPHSAAPGTRDAIPDVSYTANTLSQPFAQPASTTAVAAASLAQPVQSAITSTMAASTSVNTGGSLQSTVATSSTAPTPSTAAAAAATTAAVTAAAPTTSTQTTTSSSASTGPATTTSTATTTASKAKRAKASAGLATSATGPPLSDVARCLGTGVRPISCRTKWPSNAWQPGGRWVYKDLDPDRLFIGVPPGAMVEPTPKLTVKLLPEPVKRPEGRVLPLRKPTRKQKRQTGAKGTARAKAQKQTKESKEQTSERTSSMPAPASTLGVPDSRSTVPAPAPAASTLGVPDSSTVPAPAPAASTLGLPDSSTMPAPAPAASTLGVPDSSTMPGGQESGPVVAGQPSHAASAGVVGSAAPVAGSGSVAGATTSDVAVQLSSGTASTVESRMTPATQVVSPSPAGLSGSVPASQVTAVNAVPGNTTAPAPIVGAVTPQSSNDPSASSAMVQLSGVDPATPKRKREEGEAGVEAEGVSALKKQALA